MADTDFVYDSSIAPFPVASLGNQRYRAKFEDISLYVKLWSGIKHSIDPSNLGYWFTQLGIPWQSGSLTFSPELFDWWNYPLVEWEKSEKDFQAVSYVPDYD